MMAFQKDYVCSVITNHDNKVLRELQKDGKRTCILPFNSEYKLRIKNKRGTRCMVEVSIDGTDVLFGSRLILQPYQSVDLERFLEQNDKGAKFKFMSLEQAASTGELNDPDGPENGRIQVKFFEEQPVTTWLTTTGMGGGFSSGILRSTPFFGNISVNNTGSARGVVNTAGSTPTSGAGVTGQATLSSQSIGSAVNSAGNVQNDCFVSSSTGVATPAESPAGVTGQGGESHQAFSYGGWFQTVAYPVSIDIWLSGPIRAEAKPQPPHYTVKRVGDAYQVLSNGNPIQFEKFEINEKGLVLQVAQGLIETKNFSFAG